MVFVELLEGWFIQSPCLKGYTKVSWIWETFIQSYTNQKTSLLQPANKWLVVINDWNMTLALKFSSQSKVSSLLVVE
jgi:hypothetical protein